MRKMYQGWQEIADNIVNDTEIARFLNGYFHSIRLEEDYGSEYLQELMKKHPEYSDQMNSLMILPGIGLYITHWFLQKGGAICR